jgi:hypothetical protein
MKLSPKQAKAVREFAQAVLHGDDEHRAWLMEAADAFIAGRVPAPRGKGVQPDIMRMVREFDL